MGTEETPGTSRVSPEVHDLGVETLYSSLRSSQGRSSTVIRPSSLQQSRSMQNGLSTTVPQNVTLVDFELGGHKQRGRKQSAWSRSTIVRKLSLPRTKESFEARCCKIHVLLVVMQLCLGTVIAALGFYMASLSPSMKIRECPYWAGIPLLLAGITGLYFCSTDFAAYSGSGKALCLKASCFVLSGACIFVCMVGSVFPGIHGSRISSFTRCNDTGTSCLCSNEEDPTSREFLYEEIKECDVVITSIKDFFILQCALNSIASGVCFWFVTLLWKAKYQKFHSGLKFYSYSANAASHPWISPYNPPYAQNVSPILGTRSFVSKSASQQQSPLLPSKNSISAGKSTTCTSLDTS